MRTFHNFLFYSYE